MKRVINTPIFYYSRDYFTGDNVAHYLPAKYLWHVCNIKKAGFYQPVYDFSLNEELRIDFMFYPEQPQNEYFKKPRWINAFVAVKDTQEANAIAKGYDYFVNNYRYRGADPQETNWGYSADLKEINLYVPAYTYKAIYEHDIYLDDLELANKFNEYLSAVKKRINPEKRPVIVLHHRGDDPWKRHLSNSIDKYEVLLANLLEMYPEHKFVLLGESWRYSRHPRVKYLNDYINKKTLLKECAEYSGCLQYVLQAFFCRDADIVFIGISGFSLFIESIRPKTLMPPIPIFWGPQTFSGVDTCLASLKEWKCDEFEKYKKAHPSDEAFQHYVHHFIYYSRDENILKPYCFDDPNSLNKVFRVLEILENKYGKGRGKRGVLVDQDKQIRDSYPLRWDERIVESLMNINWRIQSAWKRSADFIKWRYIGLLKRIFRVKMRL